MDASLQVWFGANTICSQFLLLWVVTAWD